MATLIEAIDNVAEEFNKVYWEKFQQSSGFDHAHMEWGKHPEHEEALRMTILQLLEEGLMDIADAE